MAIATMPPSMDGRRTVPPAAPRSASTPASSSGSEGRDGSPIWVSLCRAGLPEGKDYRDMMTLVKPDRLESWRCVYFCRAEVVDRDDRDAPPRGARRDPGSHCGAGG